MSANLPDAVHQNPSCGACGAETVHDGDSFACYACQLSFDNYDLTADYLDPEDDPCGEPCDNSWHRPNGIKQGWDWRCGTCVLPSSHEQGPYSHHQPCEPFQMEAAS